MTDASDEEIKKHPAYQAYKSSARKGLVGSYVGGLFILYFLPWNWPFYTWMFLGPFLIGGYPASEAAAQVRALLEKQENDRQAQLQFTQEQESRKRMEQEREVASAEAAFEQQRQDRIVQMSILDFNQTCTSVWAVIRVHKEGKMSLSGAANDIHQAIMDIAAKFGKLDLTTRTKVISQSGAEERLNDILEELEALNLADTSIRKDISRLKS